MPADSFKRIALAGPVILVAAALGSCSMTGGPGGKLIPTSGRVSAEGGESESGTKGLPLRPLERAEQGGDLGVRAPFPDYNRGEAPANTRIFLVAGGAEDASFLQEVVVLRDYWLKNGYQPEEVACYYVKPEKTDYEADRQRFDSMATRVDSFYLAAPHVLFRHLKTVAAAGPSAVHVYVNGQGKRPLGASSEERALAGAYPDFGGCHRIVLRGGPSGHMNERMRLEALRDGIDAHYLVFNAEFLAEALNEFPPSCEKFVVLNADYSGGFLTTASGDNGLLRGLSNIAVLTSSSQDRMNLSQGGEMSQFGGIYLTALSSGSGPVQERSWNQLANEVRVGVDRSEGTSGVRTRMRSRPIFFSNLPRESGPLVELASELAEPDPTGEGVRETLEMERAEKVLPVSGLPEPGAPKAESGPAEVGEDRRTTATKAGGSGPVSSPPIAWLAPVAPTSEAGSAPGKAGGRKLGGLRAVFAPRSGAGLGMGRGGFGR